MLEHFSLATYSRAASRNGCTPSYNVSVTAVPLQIKLDCVDKLHKISRNSIDFNGSRLRSWDDSTDRHGKANGSIF